MHFDWSTLVLQTINVLVLLWLLRRFLFRPVVAIIAARKDAADKLLADAAAARDQAQATAAQAAQRENTLAADSDHILAEARAAAKTEHNRLLELATQDAAALRTTALAGMDRDRTQMRQDLEREAGTLALTIASRLVSRVPPRALTAALLQSLDAWLATLPSDRLADLAPPARNPPDRHRRPAGTAGSASLRRHAHPPPGPPADGPVQRGCLPDRRVELRGTHATLRNNWRADLNQIAQELSQHDDQRTLA